MADNEEMLEFYNMGDAQLSTAIKHCAERAVKSSNVNESKEWMEMLNKALSIQRQRAETLLKDETTASNLSLENAKLKSTAEIEKYKIDKTTETDRYKVDETTELEYAKLESQEKVAKVGLLTAVAGAFGGVLTLVGTIIKTSSDKKVTELNNRSQERCVGMAVNIDRDGEIAYQTASKLGQMPRR